MTEAEKSYLRSLRRRRRFWQLGAGLAGTMGLVRAALWSLVTCGLLDYALAPPPAVLIGLLAGAFGVMVFVILWNCVSVLGITRRETAERADVISDDPRQPGLTAFELCGVPAGDQGGLRNFLVAKSLAAGAQSLRGLSAFRFLPGKVIGDQFKKMLLAAAVLLALFVANSPAFMIVSQRLLHPDADLPPYSALQFAITPDRPGVIYGDPLELKATITGDQIQQPVELLVRKGDEIERVACFRDGENVYAGHLDRVVDPVDICFAVGKARSSWQPVRVLLQPRVSAIRLVVEPPQYTRLPRREILLTEEAFSCRAGARVRLRLTSNRPLARGSMSIVPRNGIDSSRTIAAEKAGAHTVEFAWTVRRNSRLELDVRDIQGTAMDEVLKLRQNVILDAPPEVTLSSPAKYALATPNSTVELRGEALDDLGLRRVEMVRTVVGFRDRMVGLGPKLPEKRFDFTRDLELGRLGVLPGQIIELYLEARDINPSRTGIGASDIIRLEIISEQEYGEHIRAGETINEFVERYYFVARELDDFGELMQQIEAELAKANPDADKINQLLDQARKKNQSVRKMIDRMAKDYQAYAIEKQFSEMLSEIADRFKTHERLLDGQSAGSPSLQDIVQRVLEDLRKDQASVRHQVAIAQDLQKVAAVMEQAAAFREVLNLQRHLVRQLQRFERPGRARTAELPYFGRRQREVLNKLEAMISGLQSASTNLPPAYQKLARDSQAFLEALRQTGADKTMASGVSAADNQDGRETYRLAKLALDKLEALLKKRGNGQCQFGGMCQGSMNLGGDQDTRQTLADMLSSLMRKRGNKPGEGQGIGPAGAGAGGDPNDGYSMNARTRLNTPVFGPPRTTFSRQGVRGGRGRGGVTGPVVGARERERIAGPSEREIGGRGQSQAPVPAKYRDALKRYFTETEDDR